MRDLSFDDGLRMILAGDIGGTSTRLGLIGLRAGQLEPIRMQRFSSSDHPSLAAIVTTFLETKPHPIESACFGIAGPVRQGRVVGPNLAWDVHDQTLARELGLSAVKLINDLEANAHGIAALETSDLVTLQQGHPGAEGNATVISVGTGLGEAGLFWDGKTHIPFPCEGGHADFAPRDEMESELLAHLRARFGRISYERVLAGDGQQLLYEFLRDVKGRPEKAWLAEEMRSNNPSAVITQAGLAGECPLCVEAVDWYVSLYGAEAGNLALKMMATGGVFIGGGIAPKIIRKLKEPTFLDSFLSKGRMRPLLEAIPVRVIMNDTAALLGAGRVAAQMVSS